MRNNKLLSFGTALILLTGHVPVSFAEEVRVGIKSSSTMQNAPVNYFYNYSRAQMIYEADELNIPSGSIINAITFEYQSAVKEITGDLKIDLGEIPVNYFSAPTYASGLTNCYSGPHNMDLTDSGIDKIVTYTFDNDYTYEGGNLVIDIHNTDMKRSGYVRVPFYCENNHDNTVLVYANDGNITGTPSLFNDRPVITVTYAPGEIPENPVLSITRPEVDFGFVREGENYTRELTFKNKGMAELSVSGVAGISAPFSVTLPENQVRYGESGSLKFTYNPIGSGETTQHIIIQSNGGEIEVTLKGESYGATSYYEHFDALAFKPVPSGWYSCNKTYDSYTESSTGGVNESRYLMCSTPEDTLYSPRVSGTGFFYAKRKASSSKLAVYIIAPDGSITPLNENITLSDSWTLIPFSVVKPESRLAFSMTNACLDEFFSPHAVLPGKDIEIFSHATDRPTSYMLINDGEATPIIFRIRNMGQNRVDPGSYQIKASFNKEVPFTLSLFGQQMEGNLITNTPGLSLDESVTLEASMIVSLEEKERISGLAFTLEIEGDEESANNRNIPGSSLTIIPKAGKLTLPAGGRKADPLDFGVFKSEKIMTAVLQNDGIDVLSISEYRFDVPGNFSIIGETPQSIPAKGKVNIEIKLDGEAGVYEDSLMIVHNGSSDSHTKLYLKGSVISDIALLENFEGNEFPPIFWVQTGSSWYRYATNVSNIYEGSACLANTTAAADTLITPQLRIKAGDIISLYAKATSGTGKLKLLYSKNRRNWEILKEYTLYNSYGLKETAFPEALTGEYYVAFTGENIYVDFIFGPDVVYADHRLEIEKFEGKSSGMINVSQQFELSIRNTGINNEEAGSYTISLMDGKEKIGSFSSEEIAFAERKSFTANWTPYNTGIHTVFAQIEFNGGIIYSDTLFVNVDEEKALQSSMVGNLSNPVNNAPWMTNYKHSGAEIIIKREELNLTPGSKIVCLSLPYVSDDTISFNTQVWISNISEDGFTEVRNLSVADKTKVFERFFRFEKSENAQPDYLEMDFEIPFEYTGENLGIVISFDAARYRAIKFFKNEINENRVMTCKTDNAVNAPEMFESLSGSMGKYYPTLIFTSSKEPAFITGKVVADAFPVTGAEVLLSAKEIRYQTETNENGAFGLSVCQLSRKYELSVRKEGFEVYKDSVNVGETSFPLPEINLSSSTENPPFTLKLSVTAITGESLSGTDVYLENNELGLIYNYTLDNKGKCSISEIYPGTHTLKIEKEGLAKYEEKALLIEKSKELEIVLLENVRTPFALNSTIAYDPRTGDSDLTLNWNKETDYFFDDFESYEPFAIEFSPWSGIDGDNVNTALLQGSYPNRGLKQYATIFNPLEIVPSVWYTYPVLRPYSGKQYASFIRTENGVRNNDWLISPKIKVGVNNVVSFKAKAGDRYKERFCVAISTTGTAQSDFRMLNSGNYAEVGYEEWKDITYDLSAYEGQEVYIAIQYVSTAYFMLMVDDFYLGPRDMNRLNVKRIARQQEEAISEKFVIYCDGVEVATTPDHTYRFSNLPSGEHTLGVKAIYKISESETATIPVSVDPASEFANLTLQISANGGSPENIPVEFVNLETGEQYTEPVKNGLSSLPYLRKGDYLVNIQTDRYAVYSENILLDEDKRIDIELLELLTPVHNLTADYTLREEGGSIDILMRWNQDLGWSDGFESYENFTQKIGEWSTFDNDKMQGYGISFSGSNVDFPGVGEAMACMVFNASATTPSMEEDGEVRAAEGEKTIIFFSPQMFQADDWLITPQQHIREGYVIRFLAKSYSDLYPETFRICVSAEADPLTFAVIDEITAPKEWTWYEADLSEYANQDIYLAFNYVSYDKFMFLLDEVYVGPEQESGSISSGAKHFTVFLDGVVMGESTETNYMLEGIPLKEEITVGVKAVYESGESEITEYTLYPEYTSIGTGNTDQLFRVMVEHTDIHLEAPAGSTVFIYNQMGQQLAGKQTQEIRSTFRMEMIGVYYVTVSCENIRKTFKVVIR